MAVIRVTYDILSASWTVIEVDGNNLIETPIGSSEVYGYLVQLNTDYPDPDFSWQNGVAPGTTVYTFYKAPNPS